MKEKICLECEKVNRGTNPYFCSADCHRGYYFTMKSKIARKETELKKLKEELEGLKTRRYVLDDKEINFRYKSGESINSIAKTFGVNWETIKRRLK